MSSKPIRIRLVNRYQKLPPNSARLTRPSHYANPFKLIEHGGVYTLNESLFLFESYLRQKLRDNPSFLDPLRPLNSLACFCSLDKPCHVDVILKYL